MNTFELHQKDVTLTPAFAAGIRDRAEKLGRFNAHIHRCRITVEGPGAHHAQGHYGVRVDLVVRGAEIIVEKHAEANLEQALKAAFQAAERRLEERVRRARGQVKTHATG